MIQGYSGHHASCLSASALWCQVFRSPCQRKNSIKSSDVTSHLIKPWNTVLQKVTDFESVEMAAENNRENSWLKIQLDLQSMTSPLLQKALDLQIPTGWEGILQTYPSMCNLALCALPRQQCWPGNTVTQPFRLGSCGLSSAFISLSFCIIINTNLKAKGKKYIYPQNFQVKLDSTALLLCLFNMEDLLSVWYFSF